MISGIDLLLVAIAEMQELFFFQLMSRYGQMMKW